MLAVICRAMKKSSRLLFRADFGVLSPRTCLFSRFYSILFFTIQHVRMKHIAETFLCKYSYAIEIYYATHFALDKLKSFNKKL